MSKIKSLTSRQIIKLLKEKGFLLHRKTGSHFVFYHPENKKCAIVPVHSKDIAKGILISILKQADIDCNELR